MVLPVGSPVIVSMRGGVGAVEITIDSNGEIHTYEEGANTVVHS